MIANVDDKRVLCFSRFFECVEQITNLRIEATHAVVVICRILTKLRRVEAEIGQRLDVFACQRIFRQSFYLFNKRPVRIRIVYAEKKRLVTCRKKLRGVFGVVPEFLAIKIRGRCFFYIKWKRSGRIDMQLTNDACAITGLL